MIKNISKDEFLRNNVVFFVGSILVSVLNYLYHPILGRIMSVEDFGEVQALISLFLQISVLTSVFNIIIINIVVNNEDDKQRDIIISLLKKVALFIVGILFFIIIIFSTFLQNFFKFNSFYPFISLAILILIGTLFAFRNACLQGKNDFKRVSIAGIIFSAGRLVFAIIFIYFGWRSFGAISALVIAQAIALFYVYLKTRKTFHLNIFVKNDINLIIRKELKYALLVFLSVLTITFLYTADVLMVKHWFSPEEAGLYSGVATIARIIFFAASSVAGVLLAAVKLKNSSQENKIILRKALILVALIAGSIFLIFLLFPSLVIKFMIGPRYMTFNFLLRKLGLLSFLVSLINLLFFYFLALRKNIIISVALLGPILILFLSFFRHESLEQIINNFLFGSFLVLVLLFSGLKNNQNILNKQNA